MTKDSDISPLEKRPVGHFKQMVRKWPVVRILAVLSKAI